jgi:hypothetical protein
MEVSFSCPTSPLRIIILPYTFGERHTKYYIRLGGSPILGSAPFYGLYHVNADMRLGRPYVRNYPCISGATFKQFRIASGL